MLVGHEYLYMDEKWNIVTLLYDVMADEEVSRISA